MTVADLLELTITGVFDRGIPNLERIAIVANQQVNMGQFGLLLGVRGSGSAAMPVRDNFLWFGDGLVNNGDIIFVFTGPGELRVTTLPNSSARLISVHWGRTQICLADPSLVPILIRVDAVMIPTEAPPNPPRQLSSK